MDELDHKIVCWGDYAIPVPLWANWMTLDGNGRIQFHQFEPMFIRSCWLGNGKETMYFHELNIDLPSQGEWTQQKYWIGDE